MPSDSVPSATAAPETGTASGDGHFLRRWFQVLANRLLLTERTSTDAHTVRVGATSPSDWWIQVLPSVHARCGSCGFYATHEKPSEADQKRELHELHEALVLLTMYARCDYTAWLHEMRHTARLRLARDEPIPIRYSFVVSGDNGVDGNYYSCKLFTSEFGTTNHHYSDAFTNSYRELERLAVELTTSSPSLHDPIPIRLELSQTITSKTCDAELLSNMADTVDHFCRLKRGPFQSYELDSVELRLRRHALSSETLTTIGRILDSRVDVNYIELPGKVFGPFDTQELHTAWRLLAHKLFQLHENDGEFFQPRVKRLELPPVYFSTNLAASWLPLLATTTNVQSLTINGSIDPPQLSASLAWSYLAYAMFSADSRNSVDSLHLRDTFDVPPETVASVERITNSATPLLDLWETLENHQSVTNITLPTAITGKAEPPVLRVSTPGSFGLKRLILGMSKSQAASVDHDIVRTFMRQIIRSTSETLIDLGVDGAEVNDSTLSEIFDLCPTLSSVRLHGAVLQSLDFHHKHLSSLDLRFIKTSRRALHTFLNSLYAEGGANTLKIDRLRIGEGWSLQIDADAARLLQEVLKSNQKLSYLHISRSHDELTPTPNRLWTDLKAHDGTLIASRDEPLPLESKLEFLASSQAFSEKRHLEPLNRDVLMQVFAFAASPRRRTVTIDVDKSSVAYF